MSTPLGPREKLSFFHIANWDNFRNSYPSCDHGRGVEILSLIRPGGDAGMDESERILPDLLIGWHPGLHQNRVYRPPFDYPNGPSVLDYNSIRLYKCSTADACVPKQVGGERLSSLYFSCTLQTQDKSQPLYVNVAIYW